MKRTLTEITPKESARFDELFSRSRKADPKWLDQWATYREVLIRQKERGIDLMAVAAIVEVAPLNAVAGHDVPQRELANYRQRCRKALKRLTELEADVRWIYCLDHPLRWSDGTELEEPDARQFLNALAPIRARFAKEVLPAHRPKGHLEEARRKLRDLGVLAKDVDLLLLPARSPKRH